MGNIYLHWYRYKSGNGNFGDELNEYILKRISICDVVCIPIEIFQRSNFLNFKICLHRFLFQKYTFANIIESLEWKLLFNKTFLCIGSVIAVNRNKSTNIWGSGLISKDEIIYPANILAVRGRMTQKRLKELNIPYNDVIGDPALLLPLIKKPINFKHNKVSIIAHFCQSQKVKEIFANVENVNIIDITDDLEKILDDLSGSSLVLSSSLHGIIVAHAYGVKALWCNFDEVKPNGDQVKFYDYFSSVGIPDYQYVEVFCSENLERTIKEINSWKNYLLPSVNLVNIQRDLLACFPYKLKEEFKNI